MKEHSAFVAVRLTEGKLWIDTDTLSGDKEQAETFSRRAGHIVPAWDKNNPVQAIIAVTVKPALECEHGVPAEISCDDCKALTRIEATALLLPTGAGTSHAGTE